MKPSVLVLGGGVAGLAAAVEAARLGFRPTLLEEKHFLGGRAYSFRDSASGEELDNGQHVFLTAYRHTWKYLKTIGSLDKLHIQPSLSLPFREIGGKDAVFRFGWCARLGLLRALLKSGKIGDITRFGFINRGCVPNFPAFRDLDAINVDQWLEHCKISEELRQIFYRPVAIAALNQDPTQASAAMLVAVLRQAFKTFGTARMAIPSEGLSALLVDPAMGYLQKQGAGIHTNQRVEKLHFDESRVTGVQTADGKRWTADFYVCALPPQVLSRLMPEFSALGKLNFSSIISIYLWLEDEITPHYFEGLLGTRIQWLFNRKALFGLSGKKAASTALVVSGADKYLSMSKEEIVEMAAEDLSRLYPSFSKQKIRRSIVIKEKFATISHQVGQLRYRPGSQTRLKNFFLAGDWVNTGLPATIESATASAHACVREIALDRTS